MFDEDFDGEDDELSEREYAARDEFNSTQAQLRELLERTGARRVEVECGGVGLCQFIRPWLIEEGGRRRPVEADEACPSAGFLRKWQAPPGRGAWFCSREGYSGCVLGHFREAIL